MRQNLAGLMAVAFLAATLWAAPTARVSTSPAAQNHKDTKKSSKSQKIVKSKPKKRARHYQIGKASWYGGQFNGRPTASGEIFNMFELTAAHRDLPLGTWVRVTNLHNGNSVVVRINDRGPVPVSRIIDLSYQAATLLEMRAQGLSRVKVEVIDPEEIAMALDAGSIN